MLGYAPEREPTEGRLPHNVPLFEVIRTLDWEIPEAAISVELGSSEQVGPADVVPKPRHSGPGLYGESVPPGEGDIDDPRQTRSVRQAFKTAKGLLSHSFFFGVAKHRLINHLPLPRLASLAR